MAVSRVLSLRGLSTACGSRPAQAQGRRAAAFSPADRGRPGAARSPDSRRIAPVRPARRCCPLP